MARRPLLPALLVLALVACAAAQTCPTQDINDQCFGYACDVVAEGTCDCSFNTEQRACTECDTDGTCLATDCAVFDACSECDPTQCTLCSDPFYGYSPLLGVVSPLA